MILSPERGIILTPTQAAPALAFSFSSHQSRHLPGGVSSRLSHLAPTHHATTYPACGLRILLVAITWLCAEERRIVSSPLCYFQSLGPLNSSAMPSYPKFFFDSSVNFWPLIPTKSSMSSSSVHFLPPSSSYRDSNPASTDWLNQNSPMMIE